MGGRKSRLISSEASHDKVLKQAVIVWVGELQKKRRSSPAGSRENCRKPAGASRRVWMSRRKHSPIV